MDGGKGGYSRPNQIVKKRMLGSGWDRVRGTKELGRLVLEIQHDIAPRGAHF